LVRLGAALCLPLLVPALITGILWALPGDPASIICPPEICQEGTAELARHWNLDQGPVHFYTSWLGDALNGDLGRSWRMMQGAPVIDMLWEHIPNTALLVLLSLVPVLLASVAAAMGWMSARLDTLWQGVGLIPAVILSLLLAAYVEITYGAVSYEGWPGMLRLLLGALVLGIADGTLAGAVVGTRSVFEEEVKQRYVQIAVLRGESELANALPNVLPALVGQARARILNILSGTVVVEVVFNITGVGNLLWNGTLKSDFGVVLAAAWVFALFSAGLLVLQAVSEIALAMHIRRSPPVLA
jgi:ABC-type dipeptide/oligopeptide/nickel transport system permease component